MSTSYTSPTSHTSLTSYTTLTSHTSHTTPTSHTSHIIRTSHTTLTSHTSHKTTHHTTPSTQTTPAFAVAAPPCFQDNELRALESHSHDASLFCTIYLRHPFSSLPTYVSQFGRPEIKSACSCFDAGDDVAGSRVTTVKTETDFDLIAAASTSSTSVLGDHFSRASSKPSTSTARSSSAPVPLPGRFAVALVSMLVVSSAGALLIGS